MNKRYQVDLQDMQSVCELNYARLSRLLPQLEQLQAPYAIDVGSLHHQRQITFSAVEQSPYTTVLDVRQCDLALTWLPPAAFRVRVYRDAQMAEVISYQGQRHFRARYGYPNAEMYHPDEKAQLNRHLGEWLAYCLREGRSAYPVLNK